MTRPLSKKSSHSFMQRGSLRGRLFLCIAGAALVFVVVLTLLNLLFFHDYYLMQKRNSLAKVYQQINESYNSEEYIQSEDGIAWLESLETSSNMEIYIANPFGSMLYRSAFSRKDVGSMDIMPRIQRDIIVDQEDLAVWEKNGYFFGKETFKSGDLSYLVLMGQLSNGDYVVLRILSSTVQENVMFNFVFLVISGLFALFVCLICGYFIAGWFTRPLTEMKEVAQAVSRMDFSKKYTGNSQDEIGQLGDSINQMSAYLEKSIGDLQSMNAQLSTEIEKKERIDNMRKEFIINVSHELKTPIALIQGYAEGLKVGISTSKEDQDYYCDTIVDEAKHMNHMVQQLLSLSKIELGSTLPIYTEVEVYEICESVVAKTRLMWQEKQQIVDLSGIGEEVVQADYDMLAQIITNYVTNAIDHTPTGGHIWLRSSTDSKHVIITVRNEGSQLDPDEMDKIWDKFYKLDKARTRITGGGSGIGLSIVRAMAAAHHGGSGVRNVDGGVEFYVTLPKQPPLQSNTSSSFRGALPHTPQPFEKV